MNLVFHISKDGSERELTLEVPLQCFRQTLPQSVIAVTQVLFGNILGRKI